MRSFMFFASILCAGASAGCLRKTEYKCTDSTQCGANGQCEDVGFCSFPASDCDSGRKFGEYSGSTYSNTCVGGGGVDPDAAVVDGSMTDGMMMADASSPGCPGNYTLTSGTHKYRVISANGTWMAHKNTCGADNNSYLAIPDTQGELDFIINSSGVARTWVGISDNDTNAFVTVKGAAYPSTTGSGLWDTNEPDNNPTSGPNNGNCAQADDNNNKLVDEDCIKTRPAVCECEP